MKSEKAFQAATALVMECAWATLLTAAALLLPLSQALLVALLICAHAAATPKLKAYKNAPKR